MTIYTIYTDGNGHTEKHAYNHFEGECITSTIEDALYIFHELTPLYSPDWRLHLLHGEAVTFSYHNLEFCSITWDEETKTVHIVDEERAGD